MSLSNQGSTCPHPLPQTDLALCGSVVRRGPCPSSSDVFRSEWTLWLKTPTSQGLPRIRLICTHDAAQHRLVGRSAPRSHSSWLTVPLHPVAGEGKDRVCGVTHRAWLSWLALSSCAHGHNVPPCCSAVCLAVADEVLADGTGLRVEKHLQSGVCRSHLHHLVRACPRLLLPESLGPEMSAAGTGLGETLREKPTPA